MSMAPRQARSLVGTLFACTLSLTACKGDAVREGDDPHHLSVVAVGDIMLGTDFPENRLPEDDGASLLAPVADLLRSADITFGNLEGVLQDGGEARKQCQPQTPCYVFRSPSRYAQHLRRAGFDAVSLANNHARDFGEQGRDSTMRALDRAGIRYSGRFGDIASWNVKGKRVALLAFAPFKGANPMLDGETAVGMIRDADRDHDVVLVSFHGGSEGEQSLNLPFGREYFHGEDRGDVVAFARAAIDAGADLVLGHGPHVPRAVELYRERLIAYSLGNFCTYWGIKVQGRTGLAPILRVRLDADGRFRDGRIISARQERPWGPRPDGSHSAARLIRQLTETDFPRSRLQIGRRGELHVVEPPDPAIASALGP